MIYTLNQKIFIIKRYYQSGNSTDKVQTEFPTRFIINESPSCEIITKLINFFEQYGCICECECGKKAPYNLNMVADSYEFAIKNELNIAEEDIKSEDNYEEQPSDSLSTSQQVYDDFKEQNCEDEQVPAEENLDISDDEVSIKKNKKVRLDLRCKQCGRQFMRADRFRTHVEKHKNQCKICGKQPRNIVQHMRYHTGEKCFVCYVCGLQCFKSDQLNSHMRSHQNERPFTCPTCNKGFKSKQDLNRHEKTHIPFDKRPIQCDVCQKRFCFNREYNVHKKIHTGDKPYFCNECELGFNTSWSLKMHARTHSGEKPFQCEYCDKAFSRSGSLNIHVRIHTGEKPYSCKICHKSFYDAGSRGVHENKHLTN